MVERFYSNSVDCKMTCAFVNVVYTPYLQSSETVPAKCVDTDQSDNVEECALNLYINHRTSKQGTG